MGKRIIFATALAVAAMPAVAPAQSDHSAHHDKSVQVAQAAAAALIDGEIRKVDKEAKKLTIKHGPIVNLDMPAMTMVFQVKDPALLDRVKAGDKVKFRAEKEGGAYLVTAIEK
ncbi:MAG TPA: copper-binding protein [Burkholderiales bacterium]|nr:copper-binding protein [Burkholderiales bacterium]